MTEFSRMPRYDIRNDGAGPYAIFYCDICGREFRSQPDVVGTISSDIGRQAASGLLRKIPLVGSAVANKVTGEDPRYSYNLTPAQLESAWKQVQQHFRQCPTCTRIVCLSDFDTQSGYCQEDSPRTDEIAESRGQQAGAALKGFAAALGLDRVASQVSNAAEAAQRATSAMARCPKDGTLAAPGTKFCPECGTAMVQPAAAACPKCGADVHGAKFCPECGTKIEAAPRPANCPQCGTATEGAKFCPNCGAKQG
ncbi:MAG TPA: zinc ribbon domain-containing protein [Anaerolineaceae bacterium]|nr:zinc-ribbon domain-containing protein [Longilinea sp.]HNS38142.1 zinc ribbon domain-containing protein [Anaerolineaceae bacterium]HNZ12105.1 zinc ribbon domain-containing protein [Anaerolineaceae bacterium]HOD03400.1 zinc ribbon domain-containing protein [Anaerolineaceae bacterium]HOG78459.1 zinc ribbon domain-containing protein [Anaerolineaceae bacterium]